MKVRPKPFGIMLRAGQPLVVRIVDGALVVVAVDDVQHAVADALDHRRGHGLGQLRSAIGSAPFFSACTRAHSASLLTRMAKPQALGPCCGGEVGGEGVRILVDQEGAVALAVGA